MLEVSGLWPPNAKSQLVGKDSVAGKDWGQEEKGAESESITDSMGMNLSKLQEIVKDKEARCAVVYGVMESWMWLSYWTTETKV